MPLFVTGAGSGRHEQYHPPLSCWAYPHGEQAFTYLRGLYLFREGSVDLPGENYRRAQHALRQVLRAPVLLDAKGESLAAGRPAYAADAPRSATIGKLFQLGHV